MRKRGPKPADLLRSFETVPMFMRDKSLQFPLICLHLTLVAFVAGCDHSTTVTPEIERSPFTVAEDGSLHVREDLWEILVFQTVSRTKIVAELEGFGRATFAAGASYAVRVPFDGIIESVEVEVGDNVQAGQVLARLRSSELARMRGDILRVTASLESERDALEKRTQLVGKGVAERIVIEGRAKVKSLEAELQGLENSLRAARAEETGGDLYILRAVKSGELLDRNIEPGENVETADQEPAFLIGDPERLVIMGSFPERESMLLREGLSCRISFPALGQQVLGGKLTSIVHVVEPGSRTVRAIFHMDSHDRRIRAEMSARVVVEVSGDGDLMVPRSAVLLRRDQHVVLIKTGEGRVSRRPVQIGVNVGKYTQVLSGLDEGEEVVIENAVLIDGELDRLL